MTLKYQKSRVNILLLLAMISLNDKSDISYLIKNSDLNTKLATLATKTIKSIAR